MHSKAEDIKYVSLEERPQPRIKFVGMKIELLEDDRFIIRVELEQCAGITRIYAFEESGTEAEQLHCAARATVGDLIQLCGVDEEAIKLIDVKTVRAFDSPAVIVALEAALVLGLAADPHSQKLVESEIQELVGFSVLDRELPARAAALAVLNGVNRFLGGVVVEDRHFVCRAPRFESQGQEEAHQDRPHARGPRDRAHSLPGVEQ